MSGRSENKGGRVRVQLAKTADAERKEHQPGYDLNSREFLLTMQNEKRNGLKVFDQHQSGYGSGCRRSQEFSVTGDIIADGVTKYILG